MCCHDEKKKVLRVQDGEFSIFALKYGFEEENRV
jgi:hypothetical protein